MVLYLQNLLMVLYLQNLLMVLCNYYYPRLVQYILHHYRFLYLLQMDNRLKDNFHQMDNRLKDNFHQMDNCLQHNFHQNNFHQMDNRLKDNFHQMDNCLQHNFHQNNFHQMDNRLKDNFHQMDNRLNKILQVYQSSPHYILLNKNYKEHHNFHHSIPRQNNYLVPLHNPAQYNHLSQNLAGLAVEELPDL